MATRPSALPATGERPRSTSTKRISINLLAAVENHQITFGILGYSLPRDGTIWGCWRRVTLIVPDGQRLQGAAASRCPQFRITSVNNLLSTNVIRRLDHTYITI